MLSTFENIVIIAACIVASMLFLWILPRFWPAAHRHDHNDIIGWQISVLGTTYAVVIGFMLYAVWTSYQTAEINADSEANCLVNIYRLANGLPDAQRLEIHQIAREYANAVIDQEWAEMSKGSLGTAGHESVEKLWKAALETKPQTFAEQTAMNLSLTEISTMTEHRRLRQVESQSGLPGILWLLMILGGGITILSACLFGTENFKLHALQVISLTFMLSLALVAIADIDRPYQGAVHVQPQSFERARNTFNQPPVESH